MAAGIDDYRRKCRDAALHAYGTSVIFQKRSDRLKRRTDLLTWVGFVVPLLIGALAATFGQAKLWAVVLVCASVVGAVQLAVSLWSLVKRWPEDLAYSAASAAANESLANRFVALADDPPGLQALRAQFEKLDVENTARQERDNEKNVTEKELHRGMRAALRKFQRACAACQQVPTTMDPTDCGVCGQF
ncbi:mobilome CxxCx(11)CxxC protein [Streptacidiphilus anmyonensis]|uniref:mobilome CxxCx(11)CxxC protein n=1 Tax=Streptacidiphilus anmyonensis TaxID=405782 RepID=UPI0005A62992|nr:mobilome CxxCx(11)CxxC protein [Streptacidiphilus anmyonensis]